MSHVDEGELTAYADGAFAAGSADAQRIEAHIALCENCRHRLEQARALTGRAAEVLAAATPIDITVPEFAAVRAAAATVRRRRTAVPLTWAATVILALGLGWFGRGALFEPAPQRAVVSTTESVRAPAAADIAEAAPQPAAPVPELREQTATGAAAKRGLATAPAERDELQAARSIDQATTGAASAEAPPSIAAEKLAAQEEARAFAGRAAGNALRDVDYMTLAEAEQRGIALHMIPELEVLRVGVQGNEVIVEQKLPDGKLISITSSRQEQQLNDAVARQQAASIAAPSAAPNAARARADQGFRKTESPPVVEITRASLRLRVSAPLPEDSLRALAARIR